MLGEFINLLTNNHVQFSDLVGKTLTKIEVNRSTPEKYLDDETITFTCASGEIYHMYHFQDCCESVGIEDIIGEIDNLLNHPILLAEEVSEDDPTASESGTWTFYKIATVWDHVTIRWYGSSNGYYSESASFIKVTKGETA